MINSILSPDKYRTSRFFTLSVYLYPVLSIYAVFDQYFNLGFLVSIVATLYAILKNKKIPKIDKVYIRPLLLLILCFSCMTVLSSLYSGRADFMKIIGRITFWIYFVILLNLSREFIDTSYICKCIRLIGTFICLLLLYQLLAFIIQGQIVQFILPISGAPTTNIVTYEILGRTMIRPTSVFTESSHFGYMISVSLLILMQQNSEKQYYDKYIILLFCLSLLLSSSASSVYLLCIVILYNAFITKSPRIKLWSIVFTVILFVLASFLPIISYAFSRITISSSRFTSFMVYSNEYDTVMKMIGCGVGNQTTYFQEFLLNRQSSFLSGFGRVVVENGIFGCALCFLTLFKMYKRTDKAYKLFIVIFIVLNFFETALYGIYLVLILMLPLSHYYQKNQSTH